MIAVFAQSVRRFVIKDMMFPILGIIHFTFLCIDIVVMTVVLFSITQRYIEIIAIVGLNFHYKLMIKSC